MLELAAKLNNVSKAFRTWATVALFDEVDALILERLLDLFLVPSRSLILLKKIWFVLAKYAKMQENPVADTIKKC